MSKEGGGVEIVWGKETQELTCTGVKMVRKRLCEGRVGWNGGVRLRGSEREECGSIVEPVMSAAASGCVERGQDSGLPGQPDGERR